jgi:hypothetical protein
MVQAAPLESGAETTSNLRPAHIATLWAGLVLQVGFPCGAHTTGGRPQARLGFPSGFCRRAELLTLLFMLVLFGRDHRRWPRKPGGPSLFEPSLKVERDDSHIPPPGILPWLLTRLMREGS